MQETLQETETEHVGAPLPAAAPDVSRLRAAWTLLKQAVVGTEQDYTEGSLNKAVFLLSVPMILEMVMESVFGVLDVYFVGRLGADAVAAVGLTESLLTIAFAVAIGLSMSATALVARRIGEKDPEQAARTAVQAIGLGVVTSLPFALGGVSGTRPLMGLMGAPQSVIDVGWGYTAWMLAGNASIMLLFLINAVFRGAGDATVAMRSLWIANAVNIVLDPCLIFGLGPFPELGVTGAAIGTTIGRSVGVAYQLRALGSTHGRAADRAPAPGARPRRDAAPRQGVRRRDRPVPDRDGELAGARAHPDAVRRRGARGLHDRAAHHHRGDTAVVGDDQRGRDARRPEPRGRQARARGEERCGWSASTTWCSCSA